MIRAVILALLVASLPGRAAAQGTPAAERRVVDRAARLDETGQTDEAVGVLQEFLATHPAAPEALELLHRLFVDRGDVLGFLPTIERAAERDPDAPGIRGLRIQTLVEAGRTDVALELATRWASDRPDEPLAALALASARVASGDSAGAVRALEGAETRVDDPGPLRARRADLAVALGDDAGAIEAWIGLLSTDPPDVDGVAGDLAAAGERREGLLAGLVSELVRSGVPTARGGALVALRLGAAREAHALAQGALGDEPTAFLRDYVREADQTGLAGEVSWAAGLLVQLSPRPIDRLRWRAMAADRALVAGDSGVAREAFAELAAETSPGDAPHEAASRRLFGLLAADPAELDEAEQLLERYAEQYPDSVRARAEMVGRLVLGYARGGDVARSEARLREGRRQLGERGLEPLEAAGAQVAWYGGRRDSALARLGRSLGDPGLTPAERTSRLRTATVLEAADSTEVALSGRMALGLWRDAAGFDPGPALGELAGSPASPGRPGVLVCLATLAEEAGRSEVAAGLRRRVVDGFPTSPEAPVALLALARAAPRADRRDWLVRLIVGYPESALAPVARRLLAELDGGAESG